MSNISKEQREVLALIDAILAMTEKRPDDITNLRHKSFIESV